MRFIARLSIIKLVNSVEDLLREFFPFKLKFFELFDLLLVELFVLTLFPQRMLSTYEFIHNKADCPKVDWLAIRFFSKNLLWSGVN